MKLLVTGASSDTGQRVVARLREMGHHVVLFARQAESDLASLDLIPGRLPEPGQPWGEDGEAFDRALQGCAIVCHLAHIRFAPAVVQRAHAAGVMRIICLSSMRRFTQWPDAAALSVIAAEEALVHGPPGWVVLRATMIYGGGHDRNISRLIDLVERWPVLALPGGGRHLIQPLHVDDLVEAILYACHSPGVQNRFFHLGGPEPISLRDAVRTIATALGKRPLILPIPLGPARLLARLCGREVYERVRRMGEDRTTSAPLVLGRRDRERHAHLRRLVEARATHLPVDSGPALGRPSGFPHIWWAHHHRQPRPFAQGIAEMLSHRRAAHPL